MESVSKHPLVRELLKCGLPSEDFAIFGSGPLMAHGILESKDLDLVARGRALELSAERGEMGKTAAGDPVIRLAGGEIEVFDRWAPGEWDVDTLVDSADALDGLRFVKLGEVRKWKESMGRPKDKIHLELIEAHLKDPEKDGCPVCAATKGD